MISQEAYARRMEQGRLLTRLSAGGSPLKGAGLSKRERQWALDFMARHPKLRITTVVCVAKSCRITRRNGEIHGGPLPGG